MKQRLTPQRKKQLSLAKDQRSAYGNNDKAARTGVRRKRALKNRKYRHNIRNAIANLLTKASDAPEAIDEATSKVQRKEWRKWRDIPLGKVIEEKLKRRNRTGQTRK